MLCSTRVYGHGKSGTPPAARVSDPSDVCLLRISWGPATARATVNTFGALVRSTRLNFCRTAHSDLVFGNRFYGRIDPTSRACSDLMNEHFSFV